MRSRILVLLVVLLFPVAGSAATITIDLTYDNSEGSIGSVLFMENDYSATGTGLINSFVRLSANTDVIEGYNTSGRPVPFDENTSPQFTRDLPLSVVPIMNIGGTDYYEFGLDINQSGSDPYETLSELRIYRSNTPGLTTTTLSGLGTLIWQMPDTPDNYNIELNYDLNTGSGSGDMYMYVPTSLFAGSSGSYLYLYSKFGLPTPNNDGYEEWYVRAASPEFPVIPEPASMLLLGSGLLGLGVAARRRKK